MGRQLFGIDRDVKLARLAARDADYRDARQARELWPHDVVREIRECRLIAFV